jgi:DNA-binding NtrC family response regulator
MSEKAKKSTILCVDDEPDILIVLSEYLTNEGFTVLTADSGEAALGIIKSNKIDLVLLDMAMPKMNGIETLTEIKNIKADVPAIMITAYRDAEKVVDAFRLGAFDCIFKPFDLKYLRKAIMAKLLE